MDQAYQVFEYDIHSKGLLAKWITDDMPPGTFLNLNAWECRQENSISSRLGAAQITTNGTNNTPLADTNVHTLSRLKGLSNPWRYAGAATNLYRRTGDSNGAYATIASGLSGNKFSSEVYRPNLSSFPYLYIADSTKMLKDNGTGNATKWGIPDIPTIPPTIKLLNNSIQDIGMFAFGGGAGSFTTVNVGGFAQTNRLSAAVTVAAAIVAIGLNTVTPSSMADIMAGMYILYDVGVATEAVQVISVTATTFTAFFAELHGAGAQLQDVGYGGTVAANTTATVSKAGVLNLAAINGVVSPDSDFINLFVFLSDPNQLTQMQIIFDVGDLSFTQSYYMKAITPSVLQPLISGQQTANQAVTGAIFAAAGGQVNPNFLGSNTIAPSIDPGDIGGGGGLTPGDLSAGLSQWTLLRFAKSDFVAVGQAGNPGHDWSTVTAWRIQFQTTATGSITFSVDDFYLLGGSGLSSFGGIAYDYRITYYNLNTGDESNPSITLIDSLHLLAQNQPIKINWTASTDPQVTHVRVWRRGGTLSSGWNLVSAVAIGTTTFTDTIADSAIVTNQQLQLDNDAPVTSTLQVPINTTLGGVVTAGSTQTVTPGSLSQIVANQRLTIGTGSTQEDVYVQSVNVGAGTFTAWFQFVHASSEAVTGDTNPATALNLMAIAFDRVWLAGDKNNPHILYYSKIFNPTAFPPQNTLEIGTPSDPITAVVGFRGLLYVFTLSTIYSVYAPGGATPVPYPTGEVQYGCIANFGWTLGEGEILYQAADGIRAFRGGASELKTLGVDWLQTGQTFGPVTPAQVSSLSSTILAYHQRELYVSYIGTDALLHRIIWSKDFSRWRNDDIATNAMFVEKDTKKLLYSDTNGNIFQDRVNNYDGGGFASGLAIKNAIPLNFQTEYLNQGKPKNQKVYNEFTLDIDTSGETVTLQLVFDLGASTVTLSNTIQQNGRAQLQFKIAAGQGIAAYNVAVKITGNVKNVVTVRKFAFKAVVEADFRQSFDSYWVDGGNTEWSFGKQGWFHYMAKDAAGIAVSIYKDGNMATPFFTFTLPQSQVRNALLQKFTPIKCREFRVIATSLDDFRWYNDTFVEFKKLGSAKGYQKKPLQALPV